MTQHGHSKDISRQRRYALEHRRKGLCVQCADKAVVGGRCLVHAVRAREAKRKSRQSTIVRQSRSRELEQAYAPPADFMETGNGS